MLHIKQITSTDRFVFIALAKSNLFVSNVITDSYHVLRFNIEMTI